MGVENPERRTARRPTMREVAAVAGVSLSTVSRVVNGGEGVRADLTGRVRDAVDLLGYRHNLTAAAPRRAAGWSSRTFRARSSGPCTRGWRMWRGRTAC